MTLAGKILMFGLILSLVLGGTYFAGGFNFIKETANSVTSKSDNTITNNSSKKVKETNEINISIDEWIGWKSIVDANGGLKTAKGSIYDKLGIKVNIHIINDANQSSNSLIKGNIDAAGYTINRYAFLYPKFKENNVDVTMPYITNFSSGGDGIIASQDISSIEDLVGKKIAVPRFSEAQTLVEWLLAKSELSESQIKDIRSNMVMFDTPDEAAKAFFGGQVDAAATWQPYLSQAQETTGAKLLFSTKVAENIILDGIVFRQDFLDKNIDSVAKFVEGALEAMDLYTTEFEPIKNTMPLFATESNENIIEMAADAKLSTYSENKTLLKETALDLFSDMSNVWLALGENADPNVAPEMFTTKVIDMLDGKFDDIEVSNKPTFTNEQRDTAKQVKNTEALLKQSTTIEFQPNSATFVDASAASKTLNEFVKTAQILNGSIIQIEGNIVDVGDTKNNSEAGVKLSEQRAKTVATYLQSQGVDPTRFVIVGNGISNQIAPNNTPANMEQNRRTDIFFKIVE